MISEKIKNEFLMNETGMVKAKEKNERVVDLLRNALKTEPFTDEEIGWAYWNISDNLAMLRKSEEQYENHKLFDAHLLKMDEKYLHWLTSDVTQKMTLSIGGYEQFWNERYKYACEKCPMIEENKRIRFESHRAAVATINDREYPFSENISRFALKNMRTMLDGELLSDFNYGFYNITYFTLVINFSVLIKTEIDEKVLTDSHSAFVLLLDDLKSDANEPDKNTLYLLGTWQSLNGTRAKFNQAAVGIKNYIIALVNAGKYAMALECYKRIEPYNLNYNNYFKHKIELAETNYK